MGRALQDVGAVGVLPEPGNEDGTEGLGRDGRAGQLLKQTAYVVCPGRALHRAVGLAAGRVEQVGLAAADVRQLEGGGIGVEDRRQLVRQLGGEGPVELARLVPVPLLGQVEAPPAATRFLKGVPEAQLANQPHTIGRDQREQREGGGVAEQLDIAPLRFRSLDGLHPRLLHVGPINPAANALLKLFSVLDCASA